MAAAEYNIKTHAKLTAIIDIPSCLYYNKLKEALIKSCTSDAQSDLCKQMTCKAVRWALCGVAFILLLYHFRLAL